MGNGGFSDLLQLLPAFSSLSGYKRRVRKMLHMIDKKRAIVDKIPTLTPKHPHRIMNLTVFHPSIMHTLSEKSNCTLTPLFSNTNIPQDQHSQTPISPKRQYYPTRIPPLNIRQRRYSPKPIPPPNQHYPTQKCRKQN